MSDLEKFKKDYGWEFKTEEELQAAFARRKKDGILTEAEFIAEACIRRKLDTEQLKEVYAVLAELVNKGKLKANSVYLYARCSWCIWDKDAIVAYLTFPNGYEVNNCDTKISEIEAIININAKWGFEASQIRLIGTPYYYATDWQFIRFDCAHMSWLWKNGKLYQVYN